MSSPADPALSPRPASKPAAPVVPEKINVLLVGAGGREHALAWKIRQSPKLGDLWASGCSNPGIAALAKPLPTNIPLSAKDPFLLRQFIAANSIHLVVIGPEDPLAEGLADALLEPGRSPDGTKTAVAAVFGPGKAGAMIEADKGFAKQLMRSADVPTAEARPFTDAESARKFIESRIRTGGGLAWSGVAGQAARTGPYKQTEPILTALFDLADEYADGEQRRLYIDQQVHKNPDVQLAFTKSRADLPVIKASGLAKGKGVFVPSSLAEAMDAIARIMVKKEFGDAGNTVIIEERLSGREVSMFGMTDGRSICMLEACQDHKRLSDGAHGPNTGGMGALCPTPAIDSKLAERIVHEVMLPTIDAIKREGIDYRGMIYFGLMLTPAGPKVLEYNARFGDPECQVLMVKWKSDVLDAMFATAHRRLADVSVEWHAGAAVCVVLAARGYPDRPISGDPITGLDEAAAIPGVQVFHAGTRQNGDGAIVTAGGRVLNIVGLGKDANEARERAYAAAARIHFAGKQMRTDIGTDVVG